MLNLIMLNLIIHILELNSKYWINLRGNVTANTIFNIPKALFTKVLCYSVTFIPCTISSTRGFINLNHKGEIIHITIPDIKSKGN